MSVYKEEDEHIETSSHDDDDDNSSNSETKDASHSAKCKMSADLKSTTKSDYQDSPLSKSMDFVFETKYVMLNFMSLVPPEMYSGHVSSSLESASPDHSMPHLRNISKSKSFDIGMHSRRPLLKHIGRFRSRLMEFDSPSSEDNITSRYHWHQRDSPDEARSASDSATQQIQWDLPIENPNAQNVTSSQTSPRKSLYLAHSQSSIVSSSGDYSYMSDADDEGDDFSNASSIFSSHSINNHDGFLDLRKSVHIMPPLLSQSEDADVVDGHVLAKEDIAASDDRTSYDESMNHVDECDPAVAQEAARGTDVTQCSQRRVADRTKLKLNIPCQPLQLDDILLSLQTELSSEIDDLESEFEEALRSARQSCSVTPLTPQSEAARVLARIGDEVKVQYGSQLSAAVSRLTYEQVNNLTYEQFRDIALTIVDRELPGWRQVALLMVFGQKVVWNALQHGQKQFGGIIDLCSQLVADVAADFIIKQGGWGSVMNFDPSQSSDTLSSAELDTSNDLHDFFSSHNVTQVDSHNISLIEDSGKLTDHNNREEDGNVKQSVRLKLNGQESTIRYNGSHDINDSEKQDDEQITSDVDVGEILFVDKILSDDASSNNTGLQYKQAGSFGGSLNKSRYASSIGFDIDELGENTDVNPDVEENTSLAYFQVPAYGDRSQVTDNEDKRVEDTDADSISASRDMSNGSPVFTFIGDCAQSDVASSKYDLNAGKGDTTGDYGKDSVYIKQATPSTSTFIYGAVQSEHSNSNKSGDSVSDESEYQREIRNVDETIEVQQRLSDNIDGISNVLMRPCDHFRVVESVDTCNSNNNNTSNETHAVPPCIDITPSVVYSDNIDADPHVDEDSLNILDISDNINATRDITSIDICENQREMIQDEASSNQRETTCNNSEENVNRSSQFLHHISRRRVQVGVITVAALAVAVCVKVISR